MASRSLLKPRRWWASFSGINTPGNSNATSLKRAAVMVLLRHGDRFLLLQRANEPNRGLFVPVGGKVDPHEDPRSTAVRETKEETGIDLDAARIRYAGSLVETSPVAYNWWLAVYLADIDLVDPPPACNEGNLEWVHVEDLHRIAKPPSNEAIYDYVLRGQPFAFNAVYDASLTLVSMDDEISGEAVL
eukprot:CAMPEP_0170174466 /NCGR_PEP_ID=MMETSP0040_2-20121228/7693_1 /TAXON_ID=641309 /ORGANISM="Lotharella oceanica, Strain CCMP622" /LENGTH=187 /DNA_ID=CAMNT_0010416107 /DNA_START=82 /DNA_END=645 /DNA_ORIENTATION=-